MRSQPPRAPLKRNALTKAFSDLWAQLFSSPVHLDSALSKTAPRLKSVLAQVTPAILLRPASLAEALGIGMAEGEPWSLSDAQLSKWRPAGLLAERLYEGMVAGSLDVKPQIADFPAPMIAEMEGDWGPRGVERLISVLARPAPLALRVVRRVGVESVLASLKAMQLPVKVERSDISPLGIRLSGYAAILGTKTYEDGQFEIQDEGSQLMALFALWPERFGKLLAREPGPTLVGLTAIAGSLPADVPPWTVVDACAGAGGKSLAIADALKGQGRVYAYDISEKKLLALRRRAKRAGFNNIQAVVLEKDQEATVVRRFRSRANVVLVDAPCSGWGVLRRNPDIKWRQKPDVLERMPGLQLSLLSRYCELVAPKGRLVYGVCTFRKAETSRVVEEFVRNHPEFVAAEGGYLGPGPTDGFFMQAFQKK